MTADDGNETTFGEAVDQAYRPEVEGLARLRQVAMNPIRSDRVRARCRSELELRRRRTERTAAISNLAWRVLAPTVVGGVCVLYLAALVATTLRVQALLR